MFYHRWPDFLGGWGVSVYTSVNTYIYLYLVGTGPKESVRLSEMGHSLTSLPAGRLTLRRIVPYWKWLGLKHLRTFGGGFCFGKHFMTHNFLTLRNFVAKKLFQSLPGSSKDGKLAFQSPTTPLIFLLPLCPVLEMAPCIWRQHRDPTYLL